MKDTFDTITEKLLLVAHYLKWPYFIGFAVLYNYIPTGNIILNILWFASAVLIALDLQKKYKAEKEKKAAEAAEEETKE